jgi:hypothetical protein
MKSIRLKVWLLAFGAITGLIAGIGFERSVLISCFNGSRSLISIPGPGEHLRNFQPLIGNFAITAGIIGAIIGYIVGMIFEWKQNSKPIPPN